MFSRPHHRAIAKILESLDSDVLEEASCFFGGGTAIALTHGEFRESNDIDFVVSDVLGYRELRSMLSGRNDLDPLTTSSISLSRDVRGDQYGIRALVAASGTPIRFEIIHEGRIDLDPISCGQQVCGITTLSTTDMAALKLLANDDRWADSSYHCRDLIDISMLDAEPSDLTAAVEKAQGAYSSALRSLNTAIDYILDRPDTLAKYMRALQMTSVSQRDLESRIKALRRIC